MSTKMVASLFSTLLLLLINYSSAQDATTVTCGSTVKLIHKESKHHLHSHAIAWGSGSGQQSVTATGSQNDASSLWLIKEAIQSKGSCELAAPIACGSKVSIEHVVTGKNLHTHLFRAPLSGNQEVSAFGENGNGDTGDNWVVECESPKDTYWQRGSPVYLKHVDTSKYLATAEAYKFDQRNCGHQCPIMGQMEVSAASRKDTKTVWMTGQGIYFPPKHFAGGNDKADL